MVEVLALLARSSKSPLDCMHESMQTLRMLPFCRLTWRRRSSICASWVHLVDHLVHRVHEACRTATLVEASLADDKPLMHCRQIRRSRRNMDSAIELIQRATGFRGERDTSVRRKHYLDENAFKYLSYTRYLTYLLTLVVTVSRGCQFLVEISPILPDDTVVVGDGIPYLVT